MKVAKTYFMLMVADMPRATAFYRRAFGLTPRFDSPRWTELGSPDGATVALHADGGSAPRDTGLGFEVDDADAACAAVRSAGGTVIQEPQARPGEPIRLALAADPEGNRFSIAQNLR